MIKGFWCLFGVYYWRAPERLWRIRGTKEKLHKPSPLNQLQATHSRRISYRQKGSRVPPSALPLHRNPLVAIVYGSTSPLVPMQDRKWTGCLLHSFLCSQEKSPSPAPGRTGLVVYVRFRPAAQRPSSQISIRYACVLNHVNLLRLQLLLCAYCPLLHPVETRHGTS